MTPKEVIRWLRECSKDGAHDCENCPYNKEAYEAGCGKLLSDAALLLEAAGLGRAPESLTISADEGIVVKYT